VQFRNLRRTAASWIAQNGTSLPVLQAVLNHQSLQSTQIYVRGMHFSPVVQTALATYADRVLKDHPF